MPKSMTLKLCLLATLASAAETGLSLGLGNLAAALVFFGMSMLLALLTTAAYPSLGSRSRRARRSE